MKIWASGMYLLYAYGDMGTFNQLHLTFQVIMGLFSALSQTWAVTEKLVIIE